MTDARLRGEWLHALKFNELSGDAWRVFTSALMWSAESGTDGRVPMRYVRLLHPDGDKPDAAAELVTAGIWNRTADGYQLVDWDGALGQSTAAQVETYKAHARKRSRDFRERERVKLAKSVTRDATDDVTRDVREHVGKGEGEGSGYGEVPFSSENESVNSDTGEVFDWPTASLGQSFEEPEPESESDPWAVEDASVKAVVGWS